MNLGNLLPARLLEKASVQGEEYAWRLDDVREVLRTAPRVGLACIGGQVQFRPPDGTCDLYWLEFGSHPMKEGETWEEYTARSSVECLSDFDELCSRTDFVKEGLRWGCLRAKAQHQGVDIGEYLWVVICFDTDESYCQWDRKYGDRRKRH